MPSGLLAAISGQVNESPATSQRQDQQTLPLGGNEPIFGLWQITATFPGGGVDQFLDVLFGEVVAKKHNARQMDPSCRERLEQRGKPSNEPRRSESAECFTFAEAESPHAELEHRRARELEMDPSFLDLCEVRDDLRDDPLLFAL